MKKVGHRLMHTPPLTEGIIMEALCGEQRATEKEHKQNYSNHTASD
jgi:hypothetical protein